MGEFTRLPRPDWDSRKGHRGLDPLEQAILDTATTGDSVFIPAQTVLELAGIQAKYAGKAGCRAFAPYILHTRRTHPGQAPGVYVWLDNERGY
jgi:hypothetical protein